jgi:hypothetical protein
VSRWRLAIIRSCGSRKRRQSKKHYARERKLRERWTAAVDAGNERLETQAYAALDDLVRAPRTASQVLPARLGRPYPRAQE